MDYELEYGLVGEFPYAIVRVPERGHYCGYIAVPPKHPWYGMDEYDLPVSVHGGITYTTHSSNEEDAYPVQLVVDAYWFGFDCAHYMDISPGSGYNPPGATFKNRDYVYNEIESMATQAAQAYNQIEGASCQNDSNLLP